ncbi:glycosyltransferase [candidate division KSB1 bacterium]
MIIGLKRLRKGNNKEKFSVSVIIPARNEALNIVDCLNSIKDIDYPTDKWEVIVVDDCSEDSTFKFAELFEEKIPNLKIIRITSESKDTAPKKHAIKTAIREAGGEIILTTDADCRPEKEWISEIVSYYDKNTAMVVGMSPLIDNRNKDNILRSFQFIESVSLGGLSAGSINLGFPLTCSARNLSYRKEVFEKIGGFGEYKSYISGDDDLLMHQIRKKTNGKIKYASTKGSVVPSIPAQSFKKFMNSRLRHASKTVLCPLHVKIASLFLYLFNLIISIILLPLIILSILYKFFPSLPLSHPHFMMFSICFLIFLFAVYISDFMFLMTIKNKFEIKKPLKNFGKVLFIHPFYITFFGLLGLRGKFKWKGKSYRLKK